MNDDFAAGVVFLSVFGAFSFFCVDAVKAVCVCVASRGNGNDAYFFDLVDPC